MNKTTRREFIKKSGFTMLTVGLSQQAFFRSMNMAASGALTQAAALSANDRIFVVVQLEGGNDGLNTVVPRGGSLRSLYEQYRKPTLRIPVADLLPINNDAANNQLGFHPQWTHIKSLYDQRKVGVIQSVGYPNPNYSHFRSMDIWHTANPVGYDTTGWLGDTLDLAEPSNTNPLIAAAIGGSLPLSFVARETTVPAIGNIATYRFQTDTRYPADAQNRINAFIALNQEGAPLRVLVEQIRRTNLDAFASQETLQAGRARYDDGTYPQPPPTYNQANPLARAMQQAAQIIAGNLGTKILHVMLGGFDTHEGQATANKPLEGFHALLLGWVSEAIHTFLQDMKRMGKDDKVLLMTWSEFGRKAPENGNYGTDHGAAAPLFVIGNSVKGGVFGEHPSLRKSDLYPDTDAMKHTIDFRQVYATILEKWLAVDSAEVLGRRFELIPFL
ncbi:MAG: DUF1501 domain-containing protein [Acidobacteriota bacterium]|nr:DUF1501 domain-containing protein [Blastocatellia bacterium]MDW8240020.1 DUF1501 domain-containing protein [Acidobacteriota bacterium]